MKLRGASRSLLFFYAILSRINLLAGGEKVVRMSSVIICKHYFLIYIRDNLFCIIIILDRFVLYTYLSFGSLVRYLMRITS